MALNTEDYSLNGEGRADVVRWVRGITGPVLMRAELRIRFGYMASIPWVRQQHHEGDYTMTAVAGPDAIVVRGTSLARLAYARNRWRPERRADHIRAGRRAAPP